uniref:Uncharacterized protein n=1 Tax=Panagrellus redivivus TaxID=6233 RepID=A0A7E4V455_PANRE
MPSYLSPITRLSSCPSVRVSRAKHSPEGALLTPIATGRQPPNLYQQRPPTLQSVSQAVSLPRYYQPAQSQQEERQESTQSKFSVSGLHRSASVRLLSIFVVTCICNQTTFN